MSVSVAMEIEFVTKQIGVNTQRGFARHVTDAYLFWRHVLRKLQTRLNRGAVVFCAIRIRPGNRGGPVHARVFIGFEVDLSHSQYLARLMDHA